MEGSLALGKFDGNEFFNLAAASFHLATETIETIVFSCSENVNMGRDGGNVYAVVRQCFEKSHAYLMCDFKRKSVLVQFRFATTSFA